MNAKFEISRLQSLTSRLCDGEISNQEIDELAALMTGDNAAISEYLSLTALHLDLSQRMRSSRPIPEAATDVKQAIVEDAGRAKSAMRSSRNRSSVAKWLSLAAIAASLLVAVLVWSRFARPQANFAARVDELVECDWNSGAQGAEPAGTLSAGSEIKFNRGLLRLEFASGAQVMLEGPVRFKVTAPDRGQLQFGRLTAAVPERAHGFAIQMPLATVVDIGTRFGAVVTENGGCEAHVFEGNVIVRGESADRSSQEIRLAAGSAVRIVANSADFTQMAAKPDAFVQVSGFADPSGAKRSALTAIPSGGRLVLWLDAARQLQLDEKNKVIGWRNLAESEKDESEGDAWQINAKLRPAWVSQALGGRPAVRFDGLTHLVTGPIASGSDVTIICVFKPQQDQLANRQLAQVINLNGPPNLVFGIAEGKRVFGSLTSTIGGSNSAQAGWIESSLPNAPEPVVAAYVYNHSLNKSSMFINGKPTGEAQASLDAAANSTKLIGMSSAGDDAFVGDLGELLLFDSALSNEQCVKASTELMAKFGLVKVEKEPRVLSHLNPDQD